MRVLLSIVIFLLLAHSVRSGAIPDLRQIVLGVQRLPLFLDRAFPPALERLPSLLGATLVTVEIAALGTLAGVVISVPLGLLSMRGFAAFPFYLFSRGLVGLCRTVPDVVWGLLAVVLIGLGPRAGVIAITMHTVGICGRFFADDLEDLDSRASRALWASGVSGPWAVLLATLPAAVPSFLSSAGYAFESSIRSSVVLGIVGAGGIGVELTTAMALLHYDEVLTIVILVFLVVYLVERITSWLRSSVQLDSPRV